jgi:hypothetical protein
MGGQSAFFLITLGAGNASNAAKACKATSSTQCAENAAAKPKELNRPYIRKAVRNKVESTAEKSQDGRFLDASEKTPIDGKYDLGHKSGNEFWREKAKAQSEGLNQKQFNDKMNNPDKYQIEDPSTNRSHKYEQK